MTGIRPSWFTCSFSFVYLGERQGEGGATVDSFPGTSYLAASPPPSAPLEAHALRRKVLREAFWARMFMANLNSSSAHTWGGRKVGGE